MQRLSEQGQKVVRELAQRFEVSVEAVLTLLDALIRGHGSAAQFSHPDLGGPGQWMKGGMTQVGDLFNHALRAKVDHLCSALSEYLTGQRVREPANAEERDPPSAGQSAMFVSSGGSSSSWWPAELGSPGSAGAQNEVRYAYFPDKKRLVVDVRGSITVYDTLLHRITGFSHQQGTGEPWLLMSSQEGPVRLADLPVVPQPERRARQGEAQESGSPATNAVDLGRKARARESVDGSDDIMATLERLHELKQKGALTDEEYAAKKAELLRRL